MSIESFWAEKPLTRSASNLLSPLVALVRLAGRIRSSWRDRANLMQLESLPDDLRKDIGWPDGTSRR